MSNDGKTELHLYPFLASPEALEEFYLQWRAGTLPKKSWTHAAHVGVAAYIAYECGPEEALERTRRGIIHFNECAGTENTETSGYHETLTRFWSGVIGGLVRSGRFPSRIEAVRSAVGRFGEERAYHEGFYGFDVVKSIEARRKWIEPDRSSNE
jgi:Arc/MetJ-type ribon-helix-helix transcriptional regulator